MNGRIYRLPVSEKTRARIILAVAILGYLTALIPNLPGAVGAVADLFTFHP